MKRMQNPGLVLAATLALLLPLEQAHCAWMGLQKYAAPVATASPSEHACCNSPVSAESDHHSPPEKPSQGCVCLELPASVLPTLITARIVASSVTAIAVLAVHSVIAQASIATETVPALDVGSPPLPDDPGAHGLRAPPVSA